MNELILKRSIMLDSGEIIPAGSVLKNYGEFTPKSISPSLIASGQVHFRGKNKEAFKKAGDKNTVYFFRIPRECIDETTLSAALKMLWIEGSDEISPFFCSIKARGSLEERKIEECLVYDDSGWLNYYDKKLNPIDVIAISSVGELLVGSYRNLSNLKSVQYLDFRCSTETCITYYYPCTSNIKSDCIRNKKFYVEQPSYKTEKRFDELDQEFVDCYIRDSVYKFSRRLYVIAKGDNEWYENFISAHAWLSDGNYTPVENDSHIFVKSVEGLTVLHKSTNPYLFFQSPKSLMVLIKENSAYY